MSTEDAATGERPEVAHIHRWTTFVGAGFRWCRICGKRGAYRCGQVNITRA